MELLRALWIVRTPSAGWSSDIQTKFDTKVLEELPLCCASVSVALNFKQKDLHSRLRHLRDNFRDLNLLH